MPLQPLSDLDPHLRSQSTTPSSPKQKDEIVSEKVARLVDDQFDNSDPLWQLKPMPPPRKIKVLSQNEKEAEIIGKLRAEAGLTQLQMCTYFKCSCAQMSYLESGFRSIPRDSKLKKFFEKYSLTNQFNSNFSGAVRELSNHMAPSSLRRLTKKQKTSLIEKLKSTAANKVIDRAEKSPDPSPSPLPHTEKSFPLYLFNKKILEISFF